MTLDATICIINDTYCNLFAFKSYNLHDYSFGVHVTNISANSLKRKKEKKVVKKRWKQKRFTSLQRQQKCTLQRKWKRAYPNCRRSTDDCHRLIFTPVSLWQGAFSWHCMCRNQTLDCVWGAVETPRLLLRSGAKQTLLFLKFQLNEVQKNLFYLLFYSFFYYLKFIFALKRLISKTFPPMSLTKLGQKLLQ